MLYTGKHLKEISFPLGGIGTGSVGIAGNGSLVDWEIFNRPNKGGLIGYSFFAVKAEFPDGTSKTKVLQGDLTWDLSGRYASGAYAGFGFGPDRTTMCGFPHFQKVTFDGRFPIATLTFTDPDFPAKVTMKAFNPFIPLEADLSSIPAAFFDIKIASQAADVVYTVMLSMGNPFTSSENRCLAHANYTAISLRYHGKDPADKEYGDMTIATGCSGGVYQEYWYRGRWQDKVTTFWRELTEGTLQNRRYSQPARGDVCSVGAKAAIGRKQSKSFRFVISWNVPNNYNYWKPYHDTKGNDILWKNYYATRFADSGETCFYCLDHWDMLYRRTDRFCKSLHSATLDKAVIDAVSSAISVLKSPTVLRLEDGTFYGWEGVGQDHGSCEGTCTHVWSYAYALCFLFPELEQSLRDTEFRYDTDEYGKMYFRTALPLGRAYVEQPACVDGQMATLIKIYRDWKLTGNNQWLKDNWHNIQKVLEFAWSEHNTHAWDLDKDGVLEGRQHHTLDMELFGPSSWLQSMYLAALKAGSEMAAFLGDEEKQAEYDAVFQKGYRWVKDNLFNGEYFYHKVDLSHKEYIHQYDCPNYWNEEKNELKYQIGDGCEIDQMLGQWHANICGLGDILDKSQRQTALKSMLKYNFKPTLRNFTNMWRVFALNDEAGTIMCDYPQGAHRPTIPIPYCDECMTGFEYAFAGLLISEGFVEEGLEVIRAVRNRYDGEKRNPWNEIEYGSNYARPMANFALLTIFSGFRFDMPGKHIGFAPILPGDFRCFWSIGTGWGDFIRAGNSTRIVIAEGSLELESIHLEGSGKIQSVTIDGKPVDFTLQGNTVSFAATRITKELRLEAML